MPASMPGASVPGGGALSRHSYIGAGRQIRDQINPVRCRTQTHPTSLQ